MILSIRLFGIMRDYVGQNWVKEVAICDVMQYIRT